MLYLYYANLLKESFGEILHFPKVPEGFRPLRLVVPNRNIQSWLQLHIAGQDGIAANLSFSFLDDLIFKLLAPPDSEPLTPTARQMMLVRLLMDCLGDDRPETRVVREYLRSDDPAEISIRAFQLAGRLSDLFREYGYARGEMLAAWQEGRAWFDEDHPVETWQRYLWQGLYGPAGLLAQRNRDEERPPLVDLHQLNPDSVVVEGTFVLFGISYVSRWHQQVLMRLSRHADVHMFVLNPCRQYWEDLRTGRERFTISEEERARGELDAPGVEENPFLQAWGRPGREYMRLLNEASQWNAEDLSVENPEDSLLAAMQNDILDRRQPRALDPDENDDSLVVMGCAGPQREAEAVASSIWSLLEREPDLTFQDIAVMVTDMATYQTELESAFHRIHEIPYNLVDGVVGRASRLIDAVLLLLELPETRFDRERVFRLFRHPNFQARFPGADPETWLVMADELAIFQNRTYSPGTGHPGKDLYNWDQGFKRLLLGAYYHPEGNPVFRDGSGSAYLVYPLRGSESEDAHRFYTIAQSLLADLGEAIHLRLPALAWADFLRGLITTYLAPREDEEADFERVCRVASKLADLGEAMASVEDPLDFATVKCFMVQELAALKPYYGQYLAGGVTISSFMPMRPIPFDVIFVMGLDESRFPRAVSSDMLDLRKVARTVVTSSGKAHRPERRIGDVNERERDRYMFLETMISARKKLILSYVDRDDTTGDPMHPSPVLAEVLQQAAVYHPGFTVRVHPLKRYSATYAFGDAEANLPNFDPFAVRLADVRRHRKKLSETDVEFALDHLPAADLENLGLARVTASIEEQPAVVEIRLRLNQLRNFLECPLQASARRALRLRDEEEDLAVKQDEPFALNRLAQHRLLHEVLAPVLAAHRGPYHQDLPFDEVLDEVARIEEARGVMPSGLFYPIHRNELLSILRGWAAGLGNLGLEDGAARPQLGSGGAGEEGRQPDLTFDLQVGDRPHRVSVVGEGEYLFSSGEKPFIATFTLSKDIKTEKNYRGKYTVRGFLTAVVLAAQGRVDGILNGVLGPGVAALPDLFTFPADQALTYLGDLIRDMLVHQHDYLLPLDTVMTAAAKHAPEDFQAAFAQKVTAEVGNPRSRCLSQYGPLTDWRRRSPAPNAVDLVQQRFGLLFRALGFPGWG